jgi:hypothetical protein
MTEHSIDPAAVLTDAITQLRADGHGELADALQHVEAYLRLLAATHTEIAMASDHLIEQAPDLLSDEAGG